jgi:molecular chaperone HtpG
VRLSQRLASSPACLVGDEHDMTPRMQRMLEQLGQAPAKTKRILEINPKHALVHKLLAIFAESRADPRLEQCAKLLYGQAHLAESGTVPDLTTFNQALTDMMIRATS